MIIVDAGGRFKAGAVIEEDITTDRDFSPREDPDLWKWLFAQKRGDGK